MQVFYFPRPNVREALKNYEVATENLISETSDLDRRETEFENAFERLLDALRDERIAGPIETQLELALPADVRLDVDPAFLAYERQVVSALIGQQKKSMDAIIIKGAETFNANTDEVPRIGSVDALIGVLTQTHNGIREQTREARALERKEKKARKRKIQGASAQLLVGTTAIVGNAFVAGGAPWMLTSIGFGAALVARSCHDLFLIV